MTEHIVLTFNLFQLIILIPFLGMVCISMLEEKAYASNIKHVLVWTSIFAFIFATWLLFTSKNNADFSSVSGSFFKSVAKNITSYTIELTSLVVLLSAVVFKNDIKKGIKKLSLFIMLLETLLFLLFSTTNIVFFYFLFESISLIIFLMIVGTSETASIHATKFFMLMSGGSIFILCGIMYIVHILGITEIAILANYAFTNHQEFIIFITFLAGFLLKSMLPPSSSILIDILEEVPTSLAIIIAGIFVQISNIGLITILLPMAKTYFSSMQDYVIVAAILVITCHVVLAARENNLKRIILRLLVAHMCVIVMGIFSVSTDGISGAFFNMMALAITAPALFTIAYFNDRVTDVSVQTPVVAMDIQKLNILSFIPIMTMAFAPFMPCFTGEILIVYSIIDKHPAATIILCISLACSLYGALKIQKTMMATRSSSAKVLIPDIYEPICLFFFVLLIMIMGLSPHHPTKAIKSSVSSLIEKYYSNEALF